MRILNIVLIMAVIVVVLININSPPESYRFETYVVQAGDTAWEIAHDHNYDNKDLRELIYYMEQDNNIEAGYLQIGQELKIRLYGDEENNE